MNTTTLPEQTPAFTLYTETEAALMICQLLQWPEEILCGGQPSMTLTPEGRELVAGILPALRARLQTLAKLAHGGLHGTHPDAETANTVVEALERALLPLGALATRADTGVPDSVAAFHAFQAVAEAARLAKSHHAGRDDTPVLTPTEGVDA
jgi:hypothetical protein